MLRYILCVCLLAPQFCLAQTPDLRLRAGVVRFQKIEDVIAAWQPNRHVFVKGDIGVGQRQLDELQNWIDQNASHWTVVLMESAASERYRAKDGREYHELDAVEHALGHGLSNRTDFGKLEHPQTGESYGAIFVLFLNERKFVYFGSDAQDRRNLGEANWMGQLDQPAFRAMRNGGRIIDAAKDTIETIDRRLEQAIASEVASAERAQRERERAAREVGLGAEATRQRIEEVQLAAANFREASPTATGPLAVPPLPAWQTAVEAIKTEVTPETAREYEQRLSSLNDAIEHHLNAYAAISGLAERETQMEQQLAVLAQSPEQVAAREIAQVRKSLSQAKQHALTGELEVEQELSQAAATIEAARALVGLETEQRERAAQRALWIRRTVLFMLILTALVVMGVLTVLNRRRRAAMHHAQSELAKRESSVAVETDGINTLFVRNEDILGTREQLQKRGYEGLTQKTSQQALNYVDDLFIMSKEVRRVVSEAKELVYPSSVSGRLTNLFSSTRYQQAVNLVTGKPLQFNRVNGLPAVLRDQIVLNTDGSVPDEISMTFEDVFQAFQKRGNDARQTLDTIEKSLTGVGDAISNCQNQLEQVMLQEKELTQAADKDHYFHLPNMFEKLIPDVQQDLATADQQSAFDAVQAMQGAIPTAHRKLSEAATLAGHLMNARETLFPALTATADELKRLGYTSSWIDDDLSNITNTANQLLETAVERSIASELDQVDAGLKNLRSKAEMALAHARRIDQELRPAQVSLSEKVENGRATLAKKLGVSIDKVLNETDRDPDDWIADAGKHLQTARDMLRLGRNEVVESALEAMQNSATRADQLLEASLSASDAYAKRQQQASGELKRLITRVPEVKSQLEPVQAAYEASALLMNDLALDSSTDKTSRISVAGVMASAAAPIEQIGGWLSSADEEHRSGQVLKAEDHLHNAALQLTIAHQRLDQVQQHLQSIAEQTRENQTTLTRLFDQCSSLQDSKRDPLVTQPTLATLNQTLQSLEGWRRDLATSHVARNPFDVQKNFEELKQTLLKIEAQCAADRQAHAEAARAVAGADRQLELATQLVRQSQTDGIPDSRLITEANDRIVTLARALADVQRELQVPHGNWKAVDDQASQSQVELRTATDRLGGELQNASQALTNFQLASQAVFQAEQWSGAYGIRVSGSPGVKELERARQGLQQGNYSVVLELARVATTVAQSAVQQAEREVTRRRIAEQQAAEAERRRRAARTRSSSPFGGGFTIGTGGGSFGGGRSFGGGGSSSSSSSSSSGGSSGFGRSGW